jgi:hypothetical protein
MGGNRCERCGQEHPRCSGHKKHVRPYQPCMCWPPKGQPNCLAHGGKAGQVQRAAKRRLALGQAVAELDRLGIPVEVDPSEAMLQMVHEAAGNVAFLRMRVQELEQGGRLTGNHDADDVVSAIGGEENPRPSIAGRVDPKNWKAERHILVSMYDEERERLVRWAKACRDAGVEEHRVALAEKQGAMLAEVLRDFLASLSGALIAAGLAEQVIRRVFSQDVPPLVRAALTSASGGEG